MRGNAWSRRAEEFDALVAGKSGDAERHAELLDVVAALREVPAPEARPEFVASLRTQLVAAAQREPARAEQELAARLTPRQRPGSRERRLAAVVGGFAVVSATGSMAMASQSAMPGDVLYPVKRAIENAQANLQPDNASRVDALLAQAESRLAEVAELAARDADADVLASTLEDFTRQAEQAADLALDDYRSTADAATVTDLRSFAADSMDVLAALGPVVPEEVRPVLITASQTVRQIDAAAWEACPTCVGGDIAEMPDFAIQSLTAVLTGDIPDPASVTAPAAEPKKPRKAATPKSTGASEQPAAPSTELPVAEQPAERVDESDGNLGEKVDRIIKKDLGVDGEPGLGTTEPTETDSDQSLTGTVVNGVTGIINGLLQ
jgi:hypothetical protein